ncbi:DUF2431 domain-containing protein [Pseudohoeflea suaedae]|uniref:DUF2431 domain-containing protein n=1 Tax=Pseudohoeflea suaedae TaxID=877384 RepID=A0A4V3A6Y3_9HYPH|nr:class I SAM-dependent methyltransferase [Pseudohoeflea suaedae]TDH35148.1 DUF2431 domain-containing protein [Pseudohoeflea suaedae]
MATATEYWHNEQAALQAYADTLSSALELKRVLDSRTPFNFVHAVRSGPALLVGEGNMSFSLSLAQMSGSAARSMTATVFKVPPVQDALMRQNAKKLISLGVTVRAGVDATRLSNWFGRQKFKLIVFQFPNVGSRIPIYGRNPNHVLIRRFLGSAANHLQPNGKVAITTLNSGHYDGAFDVDGAAARNSYEAPFAHPFKFSNFPGYIHVKTKDDGTSVASNDRECVTYIFSLKRNTNRKCLSGHR